MKKTGIIMSIFIIMFMFMIIVPITVHASGINPENFHSDGPNSDDVKDMYKFGGSVAGIIQIVGTIVSVGTLMIIGIRYMVASVDEKAEYKERMFPYIIGAVLLFGASSIVNIIYKIFID